MGGGWTVARVVPGSWRPFVSMLFCAGLTASGCIVPGVCFNVVRIMVLIIYFVLGADRVGLAVDWRVVFGQTSRTFGTPFYQVGTPQNYANQKILEFIVFKVKTPLSTLCIFYMCKLSPID